MNCPTCNAQNADSDGYCARCGAGLLPETQAAPRYADRAAAGRRELLTIGLGVLLLIACACGVWRAITRTTAPDVVATRFMEADLKGDNATLLSLVSDTTNKGQFQAEWKRIRDAVGRSPFHQFRISQCEYNAEGGYIKIAAMVPVPPAPGQTSASARPTVSATMELTVVRRREGWRIDGLQTCANLASTLASLGYTQLATAHIVLPLGAHMAAPAPPPPFAPPTPPAAAKPRKRASP